MSSLLTEGDLTHEEHVVWLEDPDNFDYVRQALDKTRRRNTKPPTRAMAAWSATPSSTTRPNPTPTAACTSGASSSSSRTTATASPAACTAKAPPAKPSTRAPSR